MAYRSVRPLAISHAAGAGPGEEFDSRSRIPRSHRIGGRTRLAGGVGGAGIACLTIFSALTTAHDRITTRVTWTSDIARIVQARCVTCHSPGGRAPMSLGTYEEARPWARAIREEVLTRRMPKWHAARGYGDFSNDPSLSSFEIALIVAWADGGAPETLKDEWRRVPTDRGVQPPPTHPEAVERHLPCVAQPLPSGTLLAVRPRLAHGRSLALAVRLSGGRREIVGWIRNYDPDFPTTYWLRTPMVLGRESWLEAYRTDDSDGSAPAPSDCSVTLTFSEPG